MSNKKNSRKLWLIAIVALNLVPVAAWGQATTGKSRDLSAAELKEAINDFKIVREGSDPDSVLALEGTFFADCGISIRKVSDGAKRHLGYRFTVTDQSLECMRRHNEANDECTVDEKGQPKCVRLSERADLKTDLSSEGDVTFKLLRIDTRKDPKEQWEELPVIARKGGEKVTSHKSAGSFRAERLKDQEDAKATHVQALLKQAEKCRGSRQALDVASGALELLIDDISSEKYEKLASEIARDRKKTEAKDFDKLLRRFSSLKPDQQGEMQEIIAEFSVHTEDNKKNSKKVAEVYVGMAKKMMSAPKAGEEAFNDAAWLISEAQQLSELSEADQTSLRTYQRDIKANRFIKQARSSNTDASFMEEYSEYMEEAREEVTELCSGFMDSPEITECNSAMRTYQSVQQVPSMFQQSQYERYMFQMQLQQRMWAGQQQSPYSQGSFMNSPMGGMQQNPMMMGGMQQMPMQSQMPMMMNGPMSSPRF
ncbi:MAG: hypothetical protein NDJ90_07905 [Oligoflexia bacterium]|nr:hypothetical protein [Oligoflexia bacterium]